MSYTVVVPASVDALIRGVEPPIAEEVYERLRDLGERPRHGTPIRGGIYDGKMAYQFRVTSALPLTAVFAVIFQFNANERDIEILNFCKLVGDPPSPQSPRF